MATWIDASTDTYWQYYNSYTAEYSSYGYLGGGHWAWEGNGIGSLDESPTSPLKEYYDEYTDAYTGENVTVSGIRIYYTFAKAEGWEEQDVNNFQFHTNYARESTVITNGLVPGSNMQEWTFVPYIDERIDKILIPWGFSDTYASTAIITKIELRTSIADDPMWQNYRNTRESILE